MPTPQERLDLDRIVKAVDAPIVVAIIVDEAGVPHTLSKGIASDKQWFWLLQNMAVQAAQVVYDSFTAEEKSRMRIVLPTREEARKLGILKRNGFQP